MSDLASLLRTHLLDWRSGWSMGTFGAIAEFHQDEGEVPVINDPADLTRATRRGAIRIERAALPELSPVAYETLSPKRHRWSQAVALCLPEELARRRPRDVLTELGPDDDAIRGVDRPGILFDMGLNLPQCDFCVRTSDPKLLGELRANLGLSVFDHANTAMGAILRAHPHRIALTNIGRVEVYQKIGGPDTGGVSPPGPHTHVLPKLLMSKRTHSANTPIPEGYLPLGSFHPGSPVVGPMGESGFLILICSSPSSACFTLTGHAASSRQNPPFSTPSPPACSPRKLLWSMGVSSAALCASHCGNSAASRSLQTTRRRWPIWMAGLPNTTPRPPPTTRTTTRRVIERSELV